MGSELNFQPGMFHLLRGGDGGATKALNDQVQRFSKEGDDLPSTPMNNVVGVLQNMLGKREEAIILFNQVLKNDSENLNALENSRFVYDQLGRKEEAEDCAAKVKSLLDDHSQSKRDIARRKARCSAEQGFAITRDPSVFGSPNDFGGDELAINQKAMTYFEKALQIDGDNDEVFQPEERFQWQYLLAKTYHIVLGHYFRMGTVTEEQVKIFNKAIKTLIRVARGSSQNRYQAEAWALIGTIFWKVRIADRPSVIDNCSLVDEYDNPDICFKTAIELNPKDPKIRSRYSRFLMNNKEYKKAVEVLKASIEIDDSSYNWFAFSSRGDVYKMMYIEQQENRKGRPDQNLLELAKEDAERSIQLHPNMQDRVKLGEIFTKLGKKGEAKQQFQYVIDHLGGQKDDAVHKKMGFCLSSCSDTRGAIESFKRAVEIERSNLQKLVNSFHALKLLLTKCRDQPRDESYLLDEFCYWLSQANEKYEKAPVLSLIQYLCRQFGEQMTRACGRLVDQGRCDLASKCLSKLKEGKDREIHYRKEREFERFQNISTVCVSGAAAAAAAAAAADRFPGSANIRPALQKPQNKIGKGFDCQVLHCMKKADADWVYYSLLPRLEENHGYKCRIPARDMPLATFRGCQGNADDAACVLVILTKSFCSDEGCVNQLTQVARDKVIPIMREDCDLPDAISDMKTIQHYSWELVLQGIEKACSKR